MEAKIPLTVKPKTAIRKIVNRLMKKLGYVPAPLNEEPPSPDDVFIQLKFDYLDGNGNVVFEYHPKLNLRRGYTVRIDFIPNLVISSDDERVTDHGKEFLCHLSEEWKTMIKKIFITIE